MNPNIVLGLLVISIFLLLVQIGLLIRLSRQRPTRSSPAATQVVFIIAGKRITSMFNLKVNDQLPISIQTADEFGNPTGAFDSAPTWSSSDTTVATVAPAADGMSAVVTSPGGKLAGCTIQVSGTSAGQAVQGSLQLNMVAGDVASIVLVPGTPTPAPAPQAPASS